MISLFEQALHIFSPWYIDDLKFDEEKKRLDVIVDFKRGSTFVYKDPETGLEGVHKAYDTKDKVWRHLNFFEHETYIHCRTPRIKANGKVKLIDPPWSGKANGFTLLFEAWLLSMCKDMPISTAAKKMGISDDKAWRVLEKYVNLARENENFSHIQGIGMDETSRAKGHVYISLFVDLEKKRTIYVADGKDSGAVADFARDFKSHGGDCDKVVDISCDMSPAYIKGVGEQFKNASITFDKFHIIKIINEAVDKTRKEEVVEDDVLKGKKYHFLKNRKNLTATQTRELNTMLKKPKKLKTIRAMLIREAFQEIYTRKDHASFEKALRDWYWWATHSRLPHVISAAKTIKSHWEGVLNWKSSEISNGILEGLNSVVQAAKNKARGYSTSKCYKIVAYLVTGNLDFQRLNPAFGIV